MRSPMIGFPLQVVVLAQLCNGGPGQTIPERRSFPGLEIITEAAATEATFHFTRVTGVWRGRGVPRVATCVTTVPAGRS